MKKYLVLFVLSIITCLFYLGAITYATNPPTRPDTFTADFPSYDTKKNENTTVLNWTASPDADFYILDITTDSNWAGQTISEQKIIAVPEVSYTDLRASSLSNPISGTIFRYKISSGAYIKDEEGNPTEGTVKSNNSLSLTVLVDPIVKATSVSTTEIKLVWDDIKYDGNSIDYEIIKYKQGVNVGQDQILASEIGTSAKRVNGKLEYIISGLDRSTEYTFKLKPVLDAESIKHNAYIVIDGATKISAYMQRYNENIVKLSWDEYKGNIAPVDLYYKVIEISEVNGQKSYRTISTPQVPYYFIKFASDETHSYMVEVRKKEDDTKIAESEEVDFKDLVIPAIPTVPNLGYTITNNSVTLSWDMAQNIDGSRDAGMKYDIWFVTNPQDINNIRTFYAPGGNSGMDKRIGIDCKMLDNVNSSNPKFSLVRVGGVYKYNFLINNLDFNKIYYIGVVAKKTYIMQDPQNLNSIVNITYNSEPSMQTVKTTSGNLEQPVALIKPSVLLKLDNQGLPMITKNSVVIEWPVDPNIYQNDVYFKVGSELYTEDFNTNMNANINDPNDINYNVLTNNVTIVKSNGMAVATITNLTGNTQYVFWVKAYRDIPEVPVVIRASEASDPIIAVTLPDYTIPNAKPIVPTLTIEDNIFYNKVNAKFNSIVGLKYTIAWGLEDNVSKKTGQKDYTPTNSLSPDTVEIDNLKAETAYYFWIMATNGTLTSEWSDSIIGRTTVIPAPNAPEGFGIKKIVVNGQLTPDIGEHYITIEWDKAASINYVIEISRKDDFSNAQTITLGNLSEYKIETFEGSPLKSNTRFWIRLFAKDSVTNKLSQSAPYLTVKTIVNYDDYDSNRDDETPLEGKIGTETINGTSGIWSIDFTGASGERLLEKIKMQYEPDYSIDLSRTSVSGINKREILIPYKVLLSLSDTKQNFIIKGKDSEFIFIPGALSQNEFNNLQGTTGEDIIIKIGLGTQSGITEETRIYKSLSDINTIDILAKTSLGERKIINLSNPIKIILNYKDIINKGIINSYYIEPGTSEWEKISSTKIVQNNIDSLVLFNDRLGKYIIKKQIPDSNYGTNSKDEVAKIIETDLMKSVDSKNIRASAAITLEESIKMLLDCSEVNYQDDYMDIAKKSGILSNIFDITEQRNISRQEAVTMVMRLYEIRTGMWLPQTALSNSYYDSKEVDSSYKSYVSNAINMKILIPAANTIKPTQNITRGEMLVLIERLLELLGKI